jgi:hypothetical protein
MVMSGVIFGEIPVVVNGVRAAEAQVTERGELLITFTNHIEGERLLGQLATNHKVRGLVLELDMHDATPKPQYDGTRWV